MKVIDTINKTELDLTVDEIIDLVANKNRQVDLVFAEKRTDADGYLSWDQENWTCVDGKRFIRSYFFQFILFLVDLTDHQERFGL